MSLETNFQNWGLHFLETDHLQGKTGFRMMELIEPMILTVAISTFGQMCNSLSQNLGAVARNERFPTGNN
jgi:hypothetical protein